MAQESAQEVTARLLADLDPDQGIVATVVATLLDPLSPQAAAAVPTSEDVVAVATQAMERGEAPVGGVEFTTDEVTFGHDTDSAVASIVTTVDEVVTHRRILTLGPRGCVGVGEARYGHMPAGAGVGSPFACLLPDAEAGIAELAAYTHLRAEQLGYAGRVRVELSYHGAQPAVPHIVDEESGELTPSGADPSGLGVAYEYDLGDDEPSREAAHREAARRLATSFGADRPQWYLEE